MSPIHFADCNLKIVDLWTDTIKKLVDSGEKRIELGTGSFGYQLMFYQRIGFRVENVWRDHFIDNYDEPIVTIQRKIKKIEEKA
jgi:hypothetical protein